jgi:hypothetical protein
VDPGNRSFDWRKFTANLHRGFGLKVDRIQLRRTTIEMHKHDTLSSRDLSGVLVCPQKSSQRCNSACENPGSQNITSSELGMLRSGRLLLLFHVRITPE